MNILSMLMTLNLEFREFYKFGKGNMVKEHYHTINNTLNT